MLIRCGRLLAVADGGSLHKASTGAWLSDVQQPRSLLIQAHSAHMPLYPDACALWPVSLVGALWPVPLAP